jgi:cellulose synthase operon protein C
MKILNLMQKGFLWTVMGALAFVLLAWSPAGADQYGFEKKDKQSEQARYLAKLVMDRKKVDLAILNTKTLIHQARNKPYLPELYLRLAELYIEQSRIVYYVRKTEKGEASSAFDQLEANTLKNQALEVYQRILNDFPDFPARDKVHFFMAHEYRELGQTDDMITQYRTIIKEHPDSVYVPECYLLLGDYFIGKQDLDTARKHYEAILKYPESTAISIARYKLGWCCINELQFCDALKLFQDVVQRSEKGKEIEIDTYKRVDIKQEALMDMAYCYTECHKDSSPEVALAYFQGYSWSRQVYTAVLEKLANRYYIKKKWSHSVTVYRQLAQMEQEPAKLLEYSRNIFECVQAMGTFDHADQDVALIVKAMGKEKFAIGIPDEQKAKDQADFELYARNIVTFLHEDARKKASSDDFRRAAEAYKTYLDFFESSPVYADMSENYAEALFSSQQYIKAGKQYEALASRMDRKDPEREEKLYGAVISYYDAIKIRDKLNHYDTTYAREGLKAAGKGYAADYPKSPRVPDVLFNVAWIMYDAGDYPGAITGFTKFVADYPDCKATKAAVHLALDSYSLTENYEGLIRFGKGIMANASITDSRLKAEVASIVQSTESKVVSSLAVAALDDWESGKSGLIDFAAKSGASGMGEQALYTVVISSKEKGDMKTLLTTGTTLVKDYPKSDKLAGTLSLMIDTSLSMTQFRLTADYLESFSLRLPSHQGTKDFLLQAGHIRKGLGQYELSNRDYLKLLDMKGIDAGTREEVVFATAENADQLRDEKTALKVLEDNRDRLSETGKIRADAKMAVISLDTGDTGSFGKYTSRAEKLYGQKAVPEDPQLHQDMAELYYRSAFLQNREYMDLKLNGAIDDQVVAQKAKLLDTLEKGYQRVIQCKSPVWALKACYQSSEINREFARFLKDAPVPDSLTPEQKDQYRAIIGQKAQAYADRADQYLKTCTQQARKWEICNPEAAGYFNPPAPGDAPKQYSSFSRAPAPVEISVQCLNDQDLKALHEKLMKSKGNGENLLPLMEAYMSRGDYPLAILIAGKALDDKKGLNAPAQARIYNSLGVSYLYTGDDSRAQDAFKKALSADPGRLAPKANLAALYAHYGHTDRAKQLYSGITPAKMAEKTTDVIHPRAKEMLYATQKITKN